MYGSQGVEREPCQSRSTWTPPVPLADWEIKAYRERPWDADDPSVDPDSTCKHESSIYSGATEENVAYLLGGSALPPQVRLEESLNEL